MSLAVVCRLVSDRFQQSQLRCSPCPPIVRPIAPISWASVSFQLPVPCFVRCLVCLWLFLSVWRFQRAGTDRMSRCGASGRSFDRLTIVATEESVTVTRRISYTWCVTSDEVEFQLVWRDLQLGLVNTSRRFYSTSQRLHSVLFNNKFLPSLPPFYSTHFQWR